METTVRDGQTLADIAVQEYGSLEAVVRLALDNGMAVSDTPPTGKSLNLHEGEYNRPMRLYCQAHGIAPATLRGDGGTRARIFNETFNDTFN